MLAIVGSVPPFKPQRAPRRRLRSMALFPTLLTIGNLICGFAAIHFAMRAMYVLGSGTSTDELATLTRSIWERTLPSFLSIGAGLILLGMVFDMFDGLVARVTRSTTNFGGQLDSMADVVTFGVAPACLMVALMTRELAGDAIIPSPFSEHVFGRAAWISSAIYVAFAAVRLARFNVEHAKAGFDHSTFRGMPSPGAACVIASLILFADQPIGQYSRSVIVYGMPIVSAAVAFLMVSRVPYRRFHRAYFLGKKPFSHVITVVTIFAVFWSYKAPTLLVIVLWYAASGPVFQVVRWFQKDKTAESDSENMHDDDSAQPMGRKHA